MSKKRHIEVDEQSGSESTKPEVREQLRCMHGKDSVHCLQFDDKQAADQEVKTVVRVKHPVPIEYRNRPFTLKRQALICELR